MQTTLRERHGGRNAFFSHLDTNVRDGPGKWYGMYNYILYSIGNAGNRNRGEMQKWTAQEHIKADCGDRQAEEEDLHCCLTCQLSNRKIPVLLKVCLLG